MRRGIKFGAGSVGQCTKSQLHAQCVPVIVSQPFDTPKRSTHTNNELGNVSRRANSLRDEQESVSSDAGRPLIQQCAEGASVDRPFSWHFCFGTRVVVCPDAIRTQSGDSKGMG